MKQINNTQKLFLIGITAIILIISAIIILEQPRSTTANVISEINTNTQASSTHAKLKVGAVLSLSGKDAYFGEALRQGMLLANKNNSVDLIVEDFGSDLKNAPTATSKLIEVDKVDIILTEFSEDTLSSITVLKDNNIPTICVGCGTIDITNQSSKLFRIWTTDDIEVQSLVNYAKQQNIKKVAILQTNSEWEVSLVQYFKEGWIGEIFVQKAMREEDDYRTQLLKIKESGADFIYLASYEQKYPVIMKQIRELNINAQIATTSWINDPTILESCGKYCDGVIVPQYHPPSDTFVAAYKTEYNTEPGLGSDVAYDTIKILSHIKSKANIIGELYQTKYYGASGYIEFDDNRNRKSRQVDLYTIKDKQLEKLK
jgi:branched-chain amino acid transport system substrate-binding protein